MAKREESKDDKDKDDEKDKDEKRASDEMNPDEEERDEKEDKVEDDKDKEKERSIELIFSTGAGVVRRDESGNEYLEVLSLDPGAVDLTRLNSGAAPLLNSHARDGLNNILGVVQKAWVDPKTNQGVASVRFSRRPDVDPIFQDVKDKIIVSTSVGYSVNRWEDITKAGDEMPVRLVTSWTPHEISLVGIPADPQSKVRKKHTQRIEMRVMNEKLKTSELITQERKRGQDLRRAVKAAQLSEAFAEDLIERGVSMGEASEIIIGEMTRAKPGHTPIIGHSTVHAGSLDEVETRSRGIENALLHKMAPQVHKLEDVGRKYVGHRLSDYARMSMRSYGSSLSDLEYYNNPIDTFMRAFNGGTSDFPAILANVLNKELRRGFESAPATWQAFCRKTNVNNLKPIQRPQLGEAPLMEKVNEHGEYRRGGISETNQTYSLEEYGKIMSLPLRVLLDDDMSAFSRIPTLMGSAASDFMSETFYNLLGNNPMLRDGNTLTPLFRAEHENMATASAEVGIDSLSAVRTAFRQRKGQAGRVLNLQPKWLLVPSTLETKVEQFLSQNLLVGQLSADKLALSGFNPFANKLTPIVEPRLDQFSKTAWYAVADLDRIDVCEVAYLNGMESPQIISRDGFSSSGVEWRINHFFGFGFIEHRSWFMFPKQKGEK